MTLLKTGVATAIGAVFSAHVPFFSPVALITVRRNSNLIVSTLLFLLGGVGVWFGFGVGPAFVFVSAALLALLLAGCERQQMSFQHAALVTLLIVVGFWLAVLGFMMKAKGFDPVGFFEKQIIAFLTQFKDSVPQGVDSQVLLKQVPSALILVLVFSIWLNTLLTKSFSTFLGLPGPRFFGEGELREWVLPEGFIWFAFVGLCATYLDGVPETYRWIGTNGVNVAAGLFFLQGLAVVATFLESRKASNLWRAVTYGFVFSQLFIFVALLGFLDFWMEFRSRINAKKTAVTE